jgi:hypothetical protein
VTSGAVIPAERVVRAILVIRGQKVILDEDLAALYGVETRILIRAMKRNASRFPEDFAFQLSAEEWTSLRSQSGISKGRGGRRYAPHAFTEHGALMAASVLNSPAAVQVGLQVVRAFVRVRELLTKNEELARKVAALERRANVHEADLRNLTGAFRKLLERPSAAPRRRIGFVGGEETGSKDPAKSAMRQRTCARKRT